MNLSRSMSLTKQLPVNLPICLCLKHTLRISVPATCLTNCLHLPTPLGISLWVAEMAQRYNNTDHSMLAAMAAAQNIRDGEIGKDTRGCHYRNAKSATAEVTENSKYQIVGMTDGRWLE